MALRFDWRTSPSEVRFAADTMQAIETAILLYNAGGDGIVVQTPIYPPFLRAVGGCRRRLVENPLRRGADGWADFPLLSFDPGGPITLAFSPAFIGSDDPQDPWYCGDGGDRPKHFYDQAANHAHYVAEDLE